MAERQVTIDNQTMTLANTFLVIATQNPIESHGAYPLPEAQLDRFAIKLSIGYPARQDEIEMLGQNIGQGKETSESTPVLGLEELERMQTEVQQIEVKENVRGYLVDLATATRNHSEAAVGLSPRGLITWQRMSQSWAYLQGRGFVVPDDIQTVAKPVLGLRIPGKQQTVNRVVEEVINAVSVPGT